MKTAGSRNHLPKGLVPSALSKQEFQKVYSLLDVHPLKFDCGILCASLCCQEYEPGVGMYLLPGEEQMFTCEEPWLKWKFVRAQDHNFPPDWKGKVAFVTCNATCPRDKRPIQCRTFPLMPYLTPEGDLQVRLDVLSGVLICPMIKEPDKYPARPEFYTAALSAWKVLTKDPLIRSDVWHLSRQLDEDESSIWRSLLLR
ncbi:MAG TPA: hypothetical protein GX529_02555 [Firmicutes bacterium]|nr:hypothetical protein [Candidatus Fermentithermobacillaceae bacterium]